MTLENAIETMCRRCVNHEQCLGTGCLPKHTLTDDVRMINELKETEDDGK